MTAPGCLISPMFKRELPSISFEGTASITGNSTVFNFTNVNIGDPRPDRLVALVMHSNNNGSGDVWVASASIGGIAASEVVRASNASDNFPNVFIVAASVPAGTLVPVSITFNKSTGNCRFGAHRIVGLNSHVATYTATDTDNSNPSSVNVAVEAGSIVVAGAVNGTGANPNGSTWTNATETFELNLSTSIDFSGAVHKATAPEASRTITCAYADPGSLRRMAAAVWR